MELSEALTEQWHKWLDQRPTMLHVWIQGNGECVQGLLVKHNTGMACRSCIRQSGFYNSEATLSPLGTNHETKHAFLACHDFTPYIVSASTSAASLATDMIMDWVNSTPSPHYRTRYVERWHGDRIESQDVPISINCPYCQLHTRAN